MVPMPLAVGVPVQLKQVTSRPPPGCRRCRPEIQLTAGGVHVYTSSAAIALDK
jgi:hypothetical protein